MYHSIIRLARKQIKLLKKIYKTEKGKASERAHMVLLYHQGHNIKGIAEICLCDRNTVSKALQVFQDESFQGLYDKKRSGCPKKLSKEEEEYLFAAIKQNPKEKGYFTNVWTIDMMLHLLRTQKNKILSASGLKNILHKRGWDFKRPKLIPPEAEPIEEQEKQEILRLLEKPNDNEIILFSDESDLELLPYLTGVWKEKGSELKIPTPGKNQILCIFGFFNIHNKDFFYKAVYGRAKKTAKNFIASLHQIRRQFKGKKIHIVVDNASIHSKKTKIFNKFREKYQDEIIIHFLPKRAPILNPIERFWQYLKKKVASNWLYDSIDSLKAAFRCFIWQYREKKIRYNFSIGNLIKIWKNFPSFNYILSL